MRREVGGSLIDRSNSLRTSAISSTAGRHLLLLAALRLDASGGTHDGAEDHFRPGTLLEGVDAEGGALLAFAIGHEHGHQRTPGARNGRDVVVAIALDELAALAAQLAAGDQPGGDLPRARQHALAFQRVAKVGERLGVAAQLLALADGHGAR